ncbi:MAG TPA: tripartite tricarboxylate transporter substrate binding protein [Burkholderiales bacterium]|nr:tripartite tricarboxylate transporter substrate binding protein [Burkholderiales bacterium]
MLLLHCVTSASAQTQPYPIKPIRAIVPFVAGGATDIMARSLAQKLSEAFGQQVIVDNRAGGGGVIAAVLAKEAPADGYTIFFGTISTLATNVAVNSKLPYEPLRDYAPITLTASNPYFLVTHPSVGANSVKEFVALARTKPGQLNYASSGTGGGAHLAGALFLNLAKIDLLHIPYKGAAQSMTDLLGGQIHSTFAQPAVMLTHAKAGKLKVLGVTSVKRLASWQDAPPIMETVAGYESSSWQGVVAPARTPKPIVDKLYREIVTALKSSELRKRLQAEGSEIGGMPPQEFGAYIKSEIAKWTKVVRDSNIKVE